VLFLAFSFVLSRNVYVNPITGTTSPACGTATRPCKTVALGIEKAQDGDIINLSATIHKINEEVYLNSEISISIVGGGTNKTVVELDSNIALHFYEASVTLRDLTFTSRNLSSPGSQIEFSATDRSDYAQDVRMNINFLRVDIVNLQAPAVYLWGADPENGETGSITAYFEDCNFKDNAGQSTQPAVFVFREVHAQFVRCTWENNNGGTIKFYGEKHSDVCPTVTISDSNFVDNLANYTLFSGGRVHCNDTLIFKGDNYFGYNTAWAMFGYDPDEMPWGYECDGCSLNMEGNQVDAFCASLINDNDIPAWPSAHNNLCQDWIIVNDQGLDHYPS